MNDLSGAISGSEPPTPAKIGAGLSERADRGTCSPSQPSTGGADGSAAGASGSSQNRRGRGETLAPEAGRGPLLAPTAQAAEAMNLVRGGLGWADAARAVGMAAERLERLARYRNLNLDLVREGPEWVEGDRRALIRARRVEVFHRMAAEGASIKEIAAELKVRPSIIWNMKQHLDPVLRDKAARAGRGSCPPGVAPVYGFGLRRMERVAAVAELIRAGKTKAEILKATGLNRRQIDVLYKAMPPDLRPKRDNPALTARVARVRQLIEAGRTMPEIAREAGMAFEQVKRCVAFLPPDLRPVNVRVANQAKRIALVERRAAEGASYDDLAAEMGVTKARIYQFLQNSGHDDLRKLLAGNGRARRVRAPRSFVVAPVKVPRPVAVPRPAPAPIPAPLHPLPQRPRLAVPPAPERPKPQVAPSAFDVSGAARAALAETGGKSAALADWAKAHGHSLTQAMALWHRLPAALKGR